MTPVARCGREVLLVGWRPHAASALANHGCAVTCVMTPEHDRATKGLFTGARVVVADPTDVADVLAGLARAELEPQRFSAVGSDDEYTIVATAVVGELAGANSLKVPTAISMRDKYVQKRFVREAGLPVARCVQVESITDESAISSFGFPCVIKPLAGAAAMDTYILNSQDDAVRFAHLPARQWLAESFVMGRELHLDGVVRNGNVIGFGISRYLSNIINIRSGHVVGSVALDPERHPALYAEAARLASVSLAALGYTDGVFHMEGFEDRGSLTFGEVAARTGGGLIRETTKAAFGIDLVDEWARALIGLPPVGAAHQYRPHGWALLQAPAGMVRAVPAKDELARRPGVLFGRLDISVGDVMPDVSASSITRAGSVLIAGADEDEVESRLLVLAEWARSEIVIEREDVR